MEADEDNILALQQMVENLSNQLAVSENSVRVTTQLAYDLNFKLAEQNGQIATLTHDLLSVATSATESAHTAKQYANLLAMQQVKEHEVRERLQHKTRVLARLPKVAQDALSALTSAQLDELEKKNYCLHILGQNYKDASVTFDAILVEPKDFDTGNSNLARSTLRNEVQKGALSRFSKAIPGHLKGSLLNVLDYGENNQRPASAETSYRHVSA